MQIATAEAWYETRHLGDEVTWIYEPFIKEYYRCNMWHVRGRQRDLLIDSGMGVVSLRERIAALSERPVLAVATHTHFDHIGTHHEFSDRAVRAAEADILGHPTRANTLADYYVADNMIFTALPPGPWDPLAYEVRPAAPSTLLKDGDVLDTGDRHFEILHLPGHSPGSIGLYERSSELLFAGDAIYDGPLAFGDDPTEMAQYVASMKRLLDLPVRQVHGGHYPSFGRDRMIAIIRDFLAEHDR